MKRLLASLAMIIVGALLAVGAVVVFKDPIVNWVGATTDKNTQVINAVTRTKEVSLVRLGIEGIRERKTEDGKLLFLNIPNSRAMFLRYSFDAKLGIDAKDVRIEERPDGSFLIRIPSFIMIGMSNQNIEVAAENNDVLSWTTAEIDTFAMVNEVFGDDLKAEYVARNLELLKDQSRTFYTDIIHAVDPEITLEFEFAD